MQWWGATVEGLAEPEVEGGGSLAGTARSAAGAATGALVQEEEPSGEVDAAATAEAPVAGTEAAEGRGGARPGGFIKVGGLCDV